MLTPECIGLYCVVTFLDHTENDPQGPAVVQAVGRLISIEPDFIRLVAWETFPILDGLLDDRTNCRTEWCIIRSTIKTVDRLEKVCSLFEEKVRT